MPSIKEHFTATVRDISSEGNGIVEHPSGQIFFVPGVWIGEKAEFRITGFKKRFGFAVVVKLLEASEFRETPGCPHQGFGPQDCGGCPWQFIQYQGQLEVKQKRVDQALAKFGIKENIHPIWGSTQQFGYRNRAQFKTNGNQIGFVAQGSNNLVAIDDCPILTDCNRETLSALRATLPNPAFKPTGKELWNTIDIDEQVKVDEVVVNRRRPFQQGNSQQNKRMRQWLLDSLAGLDKNSLVLELFAGSGNFTKMLVKANFQQIIAVEAVADALTTLQQQQWPGVTTMALDLYSESGLKQLGKAANKAKVLVLDPPREGFTGLAGLLNYSKKITDVRYISCNLATFSRDLGVLLSRGFRVEEVQPLDQFPHTPHIELLARFSKA